MKWTVFSFFQKHRSSENYSVVVAEAELLSFFTGASVVVGAAEGELSEFSLAGGLVSVGCVLLFLKSVTYHPLPFSWNPAAEMRLT